METISADIHASGNGPMISNNDAAVIDIQHSKQVSTLTSPVVDNEPNSSKCDFPRKRVSVQEISPLPHRSCAARKRRGNTMEATVLTASPYKNLVEQRLRAKEEKLNKSLQRKEKQKEKANLRNTKPEVKKKVNKGSKSERVCQAVKSKGSKTKATENTKQLQNEDDSTCACLVCGETYQESWIQCGTCKLWAHEACADLCDSQYYFCDNCSGDRLKQNKRRKLD
jgi:hypothetical protein